jgi:GNAT superfamily N-acetyltransferase
LSKDVKIRIATDDDVDMLHRLCRLHAQFEKTEIDWSGHKERLASILLLKDGNITIYLAEIEANAVGYASVSREFSTWNAYYYLHMDCLFVDADFRNKNIGASLMQRISCDAKQSGISEIQWQTPEWNTAAVRFYERLGASQKLKRRFMLQI